MPESHETLLISRQEVADALDLREIIDTVEAVFLAHGRGAVSMPAKITLDMSGCGEPNWMNAMPAYVTDRAAAGIKWAGGFVHNAPRRGLDYVQAMTILNDPLTGVPEAVLDGVWITNARTGAVAAVTHRHLGRPGPTRVALIGAGMQAAWSLRSLAVTTEVAHVAVVDIRPDAARTFADRMGSELGLVVSVAGTIREAVEDADLIITATTANEPLVDRTWVAPGTLVVAIGSYQELDDELVLGADVRVVDHLGQNLHRGEFARLFESGRLRPEDVAAEFGDVVAGTRVGRRSIDDIIVASMIGVASLDMALSKAVVDRVRERGGARSFAFDRML